MKYFHRVVKDTHMSSQPPSGRYLPRNISNNGYSMPIQEADVATDLTARDASPTMSFTPTSLITPAPEIAPGVREQSAGFEHGSLTHNRHTAPLPELTQVSLPAAQMQAQTPDSGTVDDVITVADMNSSSGHGHGRVELGELSQDDIQPSQGPVSITGESDLDEGEFSADGMAMGTAAPVFGAEISTSNHKLGYGYPSSTDSELTGPLPDQAQEPSLSIEMQSLDKVSADKTSMPENLHSVSAKPVSALETGELTPRDVQPTPGPMPVRGEADFCAGEFKANETSIATQTVTEIETANAYGVDAETPSIAVQATEALITEKDNTEKVIADKSTRENPSAEKPVSEYGASLADTSVTKLAHTSPPQGALPSTAVQRRSLFARQTSMVETPGTGDGPGHGPVAQTDKVQGRASPSSNGHAAQTAGTPPPVVKTAALTPPNTAAAATTGGDAKTSGSIAAGSAPKPPTKANRPANRQLGDLQSQTTPSSSVAATGMPRPSRHGPQQGLPETGRQRKGPEVVIGQIDVYVDAPRPTPAAPSLSPTRPRDLSSKYYLRGL